jgi:hypothetical protein
VNLFKIDITGQDYKKTNNRSEYIITRIINKIESIKDIKKMNKLLGYIFTITDKVTSNSTPYIKPSEKFGQVERPPGLEEGVGIKKNMKNAKIFGKYYIDLNKLKNGTLQVKYVKTRQTCTNYKPVMLNAQLKKVVQSIVDDKFNLHEYKKLPLSDRRVITKLARYCDLESPDDEDDKKFQQEYEILLGEYQSGNDSMIVRNKLKKYILQGLSENKIPKSVGYNQLYELSL